MANRHDRQSGIIKAGELRFPIHVLGAGGIGSWTALLLAKMGCDNIVIYDDDKVEEHNIASQFYKEGQLDMYKVEALAENVLEQTGVEIEQVKNIKEEEYIDKGLVIIAVDSMKERIRLGEIYKDKNIHIIDGRMGGLSFEIYNKHASKYLQTTVDPSEVDTDSCTEKSISFNCAVIGGMIVNQVRRYAKHDYGFNGELIYCFNSQTMLKKLDIEEVPSSEETTGLASPDSSAQEMPF
jgi:molybdopterin/thiamine biosynthesis adenylyltransferase